MNRKKVVGSIFVCMLMCVTVSTVTGTMNADFNNVENNDPDFQKSRAMWDIQFNFDCESITGGAIGIAGAEFDGTYFYVSQWGYQGTKEIFKIDKDGNLVGSFDPTFVSGTGIRDMAWDGQYLYGSNAANAIYCFDGDGNLIDTLSSPVAVRSIAYDSDNDAFWVNDFSTDLKLIDRNGNTLDTITSPPSMYGSAYDNICEVGGYDGPFLWIFTGTSQGGPCQIEQFDLATKTLTGEGHSVSGDFGSTGIAGGLFFTTEYAEGYATLGGLMQFSPDTLFGYEMCQTNFPPEIPTIDGPTIGPMGVEIEYTLETTDPEDEDVYYYVEWGDGDNTGWIGPYASGEEVTIGHTWTSPDDYEIRAKAKDINDAESDWSDVIVLTIVVTDPPSAPAISGTEQGKPGESYNYYFTSTDPDGDDVSYFIDWGDGETTDWTPYRTSGAILKEDHEFSEYGTFIIKAKAKDIYNAESDWAELSVAMPRNRAINTPFLQFLEQYPILYQLLLRFLRL